MKSLDRVNKYAVGGLIKFSTVGGRNFVDFIFDLHPS